MVKRTPPMVTADAQAPAVQPDAMPAPDAMMGEPDTMAMEPDTMVEPPEPDTMPPVCMPQVEVLNGKDDDCDGAIDNGVIGVVHFEGSAYAFLDARLAWAQARQDCQAIGYDLVVIESAAENEFARTIRSPGNWAFWLGYTDETVEGQWVTVDGRMLAFNNWAPGKPNNCDKTIDGVFNENNPCQPENCAALFTETGTWNDFLCDHRMRRETLCEVR